MSGHHRFDTLRARMTPQRRTQNAAKTQAVLADMPRAAARDQERGVPGVEETCRTPSRREEKVPWGKS